MTVFKAFLHVLNKCKGMVILYTALLLLFGGINAKSGDTASQFAADKPEMSESRRILRIISQRTVNGKN